MINFYRCCKSNFDPLNRLVQSTPHSRKIHREARYILKNASRYNELCKAWGFWVQTAMSFGSVMFGGYAYERRGNGTIKRFINKKLQFTREISERLRGVIIKCTDALKVIENRDAEDVFFYIDPPYFNSDMGFYKGYTKKDFTNLLKLLEKVKGKFLLSSYPSKVLGQYTKKNRWFTHSIKKSVAVTYQTSKEKIEVLTANYNIIELHKNSELSGVFLSINLWARALGLRLKLEKGGLL